MVILYIILDVVIDIVVIDKIGVIIINVIGVWGLDFGVGDIMLNLGTDLWIGLFIG